MISSYNGPFNNRLSWKEMQGQRQRKNDSKHAGAAFCQHAWYVFFGIARALKDLSRAFKRPLKGLSTDFKGLLKVFTRPLNGL